LPTIPWSVFATAAACAAHAARIETARTGSVGLQDFHPPHLVHCPNRAIELGPGTDIACQSGIAMARIPTHQVEHPPAITRSLEIHPDRMPPTRARLAYKYRGARGKAGRPRSPGMSRSTASGRHVAASAVPMPAG
jgi:hypothetical protein